SPIPRTEISYLVPEQYEEVTMRVFSRESNKVVILTYSLSPRMTINQSSFIVNKEKIRVIQNYFEEFCELFKIKPNWG
ncbi:16601_t:CDS:1, partial [Dentiscutata heterogama]